MHVHVAPVMDARIGLAPGGAERVRTAALGAFAALLAIAFFFLLAADQANVVAGLLE